MALDRLTQLASGDKAVAALAQPETYTQLGVIITIYVIAFIVANRIRKYTPFLDVIYGDADVHPIRRFVSTLGNLIFPVLAIMMLRISVDVSQSALDQGWLMQTALTIAILLLYNSVIHDFVLHRGAARLFRWIGIPLLFLHLLGILPGLIEILESISISIGDIQISAYGIARVAIFGSLLFWLGRASNMRSTTLETYDGKDIMVPNEKFIVETFTNWTHKNKSQRYRVDFSVAYHSDIRKLVDIIKDVVASHPQVFSGDDVPIEERPDCEIDSFGDSGINMFVEFWMEGIDDGRNRVGGDLLLMILESLQENGYEIPFPQREVRVLNKDFSVHSEKTS